MSSATLNCEYVYVDAKLSSLMPQPRSFPARTRNNRHRQLPPVAEDRGAISRRDLDPLPARSIGLDPETRDVAAWSFAERRDRIPDATGPTANAKTIGMAAPPQVSGRNNRASHRNYEIHFESHETQRLFQHSSGLSFSPTILDFDRSGHRSTHASRALAEMPPPWSAQLEACRHPKSQLPASPAAARPAASGHAAALPSRDMNPRRSHVPLRPLRI